MTFDEYVAGDGQHLVRLAFVLCGDAHLAEDLTQIVLAKAYRQWRRVEAATSPNAYVRTMLVNVFLTWRRLKSSGELPIADPASISRSGSHTGDPADEIAAADHMRWLLSGLSRQARTVLVLRYYVDLDDETIAETLGIARSSVRSIASRALGNLRTEFPSFQERR